MSDMTTVGGRIKYYRRSKGLLQKDIYEKIGIDKSTYIYYESEKTENQDIKIIDEICGVIGIDPNQVYDEYMKFQCNYRTSLRNFRKKYKLKHKDFAVLLGMHYKISTVWENGRAVPTRASYEKIKAVFEKYGEST